MFKVVETEGKDFTVIRRVLFTGTRDQCLIYIAKHLGDYLSARPLKSIDLIGPNGRFASWSD